MLVLKGTRITLSILIACVLFLGACTTAAPEPTAVPAAPEPTTVPTAPEPTAVPVASESTTVFEEEPLPPTTTSHKPEGTIVFALTTDINAIDPQIATEFNSWNAGFQMFDTLIWQNNEGDLVPELATSWEISDDGLVYIFHLRDDVTFHNGEPFNAEAMIYTWERNRPEDMYNSYYWNMAVNMEAIDEYTLKITTEEVNPLYLSQISENYMPLAPNYYAEVGEAGFLEHPIGTGPFMFKEWVRGDHLTLVANPNYWREGYPLVETLIFKSIPESATRAAALKTGEVDIITRLTSEEAENLIGYPGVEIFEYPVDRVYYLAFNNITSGKGTPIEDRDVRLAMNYAVDVQGIIDAFFDGHAVRSSSLVGTQNFAYDGADPYPYDPEKAKELLADAGYPNGFDIGMACPDGAYARINEVCQAIANYLGNVDINIDLEFMESTLYWDLEYEKALPPLFVDSWSGTTGEANQRVDGMLHRNASYASWFDEKFASMVDKILATIDRDEREKLYREIQVMMREDPPFIYLYEPVTFEAYRSSVVGYAPSPYESYELWNVTNNK
jgi:peptide/nickel transport system substrate-binding protein